MECPNCEMTDRQFENSTFDLTFNDRDTGQDITFCAIGHVCGYCFNQYFYPEHIVENDRRAATARANCKQESK